MNVNITNGTESLQSPDAQPVTGQSVFWVLVTLATAAINQPSTSGFVGDESSAGGSFDLIRSIPGACLFDGIIDLVMLWKATQRGATPSSDTKSHSGPTRAAVLLKLVIFCVAVLPQTIKVLAMRGIPVTQLCAAVFFFAASTRLVTELAGFDTHAWRSAADSDGDMASVSILLYMFSLTGQLGLFLGVCCNIPVAEILKPFRTVKMIIIAMVSFGLALLVIAFVKQLVCDPRRRRREGKKPVTSDIPNRIEEGFVGSWCLPLLLAFLQMPTLTASIVIVRMLDGLACLVAWGKNKLRSEEDDKSAVPAVHQSGPVPGQKEEHAAEADPQTSSPGLQTTEDDPTNTAEINNGMCACGGEMYKIIPNQIHNLCIQLLRPVYPLDRFFKVTGFDLVLTIVIANLLATGLYYLVFFDQTGTTTPGWTSYLG